jgi:twinkle protein
VVSVQNGAQGARKSLAKQIEWLNRFESVVLMFDNDDPGKAAAQDCVSLFPPGKCKIARLPLKDPNEMLLAGRGGEVIDAIWSAKVYRPDGIVQLSDLRESILKQPDEGLPWCFPTLTQLTFGRRTGEVVALGAGTGIGKTDVITQQVEFDLNTLKQPVAVIFLEQQPAETGKRIAGKAAGRRFHVPDGSWTQEELMGSLSKLEGSAPLYLYDHFGSAEWDTIRDLIRYLAHSEGVKLFYLDHLTALAAEAEDERKALEEIMAQIGGLVKELDIWLLLVSHLATPEGKPHEEGGHVAIRHFKGSRSIGFWSHYMIGLERNQQSDNHDEQQTTTVRMLKDRYTGQATGKLFYLGYDAETGRLFERGAPEKKGSDTFSTNEAGDF